MYTFIIIHNTKSIKIYLYDMLKSSLKFRKYIHIGKVIISKMNNAIAQMG